MNVETLKDDVDFLVGTTSASYVSKDKLRNMNVAYQDVARVIWESAGDWQYDDSNATDFGIATADLVADQQDYTLPSTAQRVQRVEVKDTSGNYVKARQIDIHDLSVATSEHLKGDGTVIQYDVVGRSVILYPVPSTGFVTLAAGLKVYFDRDVTNLSDDADTPGFATAFHRILSLAAAIDFTRDEQERTFFVGQRARLQNGLKKFYAKRNVEGRTRIKPAGKKRWRNYT